MDENGTPQEPGQVPQPSVAPPPPPAQPGVQPPQYQQTAPGQPAAIQAGQAPAKKKTTAIILIVVAVVLLLCAMTACGIGAFMLYASSGPDFRETSDEVDVHYDAALVLVEEIDAYYGDFGDIYEDGSDEDKAALYVEVADAANADIAEARSELIEAQSLIESLDDSGFTVEYLDAIVLLNQSIDTYEMLYGEIPGFSADIEAMDAMMSELQAADDQLAESVRLTNDGQYGKGKSEAESALVIYQGGQTFFEELAAVYPDLDFEVQAAIEKLYADAATAAVKAAEAGQADDNNAYQQHVAEYVAADEAIEAAAGAFWEDDWDLLYQNADAAYEEAWSYYEASYEAWDRAWAAAANEGLY